MCGIFAYCNFLVEKVCTLTRFCLSSILNLTLCKDRKTICDILVNGLSRLEYRGYDSAG